jgi:hypothetical protein
MLSCKFIVGCEDFLGLVVQVIHGRQIIGYGNSTNSGMLTSFFVDPLSIRVISVIRGQTSVAAEPRWVIRGSATLKNRCEPHDQHRVDQ